MSAAVKYSEDEPRDDHGRWTDGGGSSGNESSHGSSGGNASSGDALVQSLREHGGFTYSAATGSMPKEGYALSIMPGHETVFDRAVTAEDVQRYMDANREALSQPGAHFGAWHDPSSGKVYFDVSVVEPTGLGRSTSGKRMDKSRSTTSGPAKPSGSKSPAKPELMLFPKDWTAQQIADAINKRRAQIPKPKT